MKKLLFLIGTILTISACSTSNENHVYIEETEDDVYSRFINNVSIKEKGRYSITYEYKDVRIDDIAVLASRYCEDTYNKPAHLKSITLHKNNSRLANFHCHDLQED